MEIILYLMIVQGLLGGFDVIWNHEYKEKLPNKVSASLEQKIHGIREILYAFVFLGMAWFELRGIWAWTLAVIILIEVLLTAWDFVVEDRTRILSSSERITHLVLSMNGGAYVALLIPVLWQWSQFPTELYTVDYASLSLILSLLGIGVLFWGVRDLKAGYQLNKLIPVEGDYYEN